MKFTIDRKQWLRGEGSAVSSLLRSADNKMCCLGFYARTLGYEPHQIRDRPDPRDTLASIVPCLWPEWLFLILDEPMTRLVAVNDAENLSDTEREAKIKAIFAENGVEVEFTDGEGT